MAMILMMLLQGCKKEEAASGFTADLNTSQSAKGFFVETENGYYYNDGSFFYYSDKDNVDFQKLCNKLECAHRDENCNAWSYKTSKVHFLNGRLIFSYQEETADGDNLVVASKRPDGTNTKILVRIELPMPRIFLDGAMHRNWYAYNIQTYDKDKGKTVSTLYLLDLKQPKKAPKVIMEEVLDDSMKNGAMYVNSFVDHSMYFSYQGIDYRYNIESDELLKIQDDTRDEKGKYYTAETIYKMDMENNLYEVAVETNEKVALAKDDEVFGPFFSDGTYLYRLNYSYGDVIIPEEDNGIYIYDMEGNRILYVKYSIPTDNLVYFVATEERVFVFRLGNRLNIKNYSYFEKSGIEAGQCEWIDVLEVN